MNRYLPKDTSEYLASLGCVSDSGKAYYRKGHYYVQRQEVPASEAFIDENVGSNVDFPHEYICPAFDLMDILRKENAEKIVGADGEDVGTLDIVDFTDGVVGLYQFKPDTWTDEVARIINPTPTDS